MVIKEYRGKISLIAAKESKEGKVFEKWGDIEIGKDLTAHLPVSVPLGSPADALKTIEAIYKVIKAGKYAKDKYAAPQDDSIPDDQVPF